MRTLNTQARKFNSTFGRILTALIFASMIGGIFTVPAFGADGYGHGGYDRRGAYEHRRYEHRWHGYQSRRYYSEHRYTPPLDFYVPAPSPGITLVFPIHIR